MVMPSLGSRSAAVTRGANLAPNGNDVQYATEEQRLLQTNQQFVMAFLDMHNDDDVRNNKSLSEFVHDYYANTLKTRPFCAALLQQQHREAAMNNNHRSLINQALCKYEEEHGEASFQGEMDPLMIVQGFFHELSCVYRQQLMMRETLQSFANSSDEKLRRIDTWKKVSAVFFTAASAITAAVAAVNANTKRPEAAAAAAAASVMLVALGKWIHSLLKKRESGVKKHKEIIGVMVMGAKVSIKDLSDIHALARRLQFHTGSMWSERVDDDEVGVREKVAAVKKRFAELREKDNEYGRNLRWAREVVLQRITITHLD